eukprot:5646572-Pyramimonas_sp.AAC.1
MPMIASGAQADIYEASGSNTQFAITESFGNNVVSDLVGQPPQHIVPMPLTDGPFVQALGRASALVQPTVRDDDIGRDLSALIASSDICSMHSSTKGWEHVSLTSLEHSDIIPGKPQCRSDLRGHMTSAWDMVRLCRFSLYLKAKRKLVFVPWYEKLRGRRMNPCRLH